MLVASLRDVHAVRNVAHVTKDSFFSLVKGIFAPMYCISLYSPSPAERLSCVANHDLATRPNFPPKPDRRFFKTGSTHVRQRQHNSFPHQRNIKWPRRDREMRGCLAPRAPTRNGSRQRRRQYTATHRTLPRRHLLTSENERRHHFHCGRMMMRQGPPPPQYACTMMPTPRMNAATTWSQGSPRGPGWME